MCPALIRHCLRMLVGGGGLVCESIGKADLVLLLDLNLYGGTHPLSMFPLYLKRTDDVLAFRRASEYTWRSRSWR